MAIIQDASGKVMPSWARHVEQVAAAGSFTGHKDSGGALIPFAVYLYDDSTIVFKTVDEQGTEVTHLFGSGYHPIAMVSITSSSGAALLLFATKPLSA